MKNDLFTIGSITIHGYGLMIGIGIIAAYYMAEYRANKRGMDVDMILSIAICGVVCGILGAKILYYVTILDEIVENPKKLLDISDGFVVYGGIIGGVLGGYVLSRIKHISFFQYADLVMPSVALAQGFGRIGCFLAGCCYGMPTHSHFAIVFHNSDFAPNNIPLVPTQLISSGLDFLHCLLLLYAAKKCKKHPFLIQPSQRIASAIFRLLQELLSGPYFSDSLLLPSRYLYLHPTPTPTLP